MHFGHHADFLLILGVLGGAVRSKNHRVRAYHSLLHRGRAKGGCRHHTLADILEYTCKACLLRTYLIVTYAKGQWDYVPVLQLFLAYFVPRSSIGSMLLLPHKVLTSDEHM